MKFLNITDEFVTLHSEPYWNTTLTRGNNYLIRYEHAAAIAELGLGKIIDGTEGLPHFNQNILTNHKNPISILILFDGGLGDAVSISFLLKALRDKYGFDLSIGCNSLICKDILRPLGFLGSHYPIPVEEVAVKKHDYVLTRADRFFPESMSKWSLCILEELGKAYGFNPYDYSPKYKIPEKITKDFVLPETDQLRVGINFDSKGLIRSYPEELQPQILELLVKAGLEIYLFGSKKPNLPPPENDKKFHDYTGKTDIPALAFMLEQMDIVLCMDSFIAHLSNIMGTHTVVLLSTTRKGVFNIHQHIICLESLIECSPCGEVGDQCPKGFQECRAFFHKSISPDFIAFTLINEIAVHMGSRIQGLID